MGQNMVQLGNILNAHVLECMLPTSLFEQNEFNN
jgi:hypothetical protein